MESSRKTEKARCSRLFRAIITGDWHFRGDNPRARKDLFPDTMSSKILEVFNIAAEKMANVIIVPGDIFNSACPSYSVFMRLAKLLILSPCPVLTVAGNHDELAHDPQSIERTAYGALGRLEYIWDLPSEHCEFTHGSTVYITGKSFNTYTDRSLDDYLISAKDKGGCDACISVAHGMLVESSSRLAGFDMRHTLIEDVAAQELAPDICISGHDHLGFGVKKIENTIFINPGALCRLTAHPAEIERQVQVCLLEVHTDKELQVMAELIPVQVAKPGHEVLSREHLEIQAAREEKVNQFLALLASEGASRFLEIREIVEDIGRRENIPQGVVNEAIERINMATHV